MLLREAITKEEVETVLAEGTGAGVIEPEERVMMHEVMRLGDRHGLATVGYALQRQFLEKVLEYYEKLTGTASTDPAYASPGTRRPMAPSST